DRARRGRICAAAFEAPVGLDDGRRRGQRRAQLARQLVDDLAHETSVGVLAAAAIGVGPESRCGKAAAAPRDSADAGRRPRFYRRGDTSTEEESWLSASPSTASGGPVAPLSAPRT